MTQITNAKILILSTHGFEQSELEFPLNKLREAGATVHVASPDGEDITGWDGDNWGDTVKSDLAISDVNVEDYHALVLPGGQMNPDILRMNDKAIDIVRTFHNAGKPLAAICHAPWLLIEAGVIKGREATSWPSVRTDLENAGAKWVDKEVAIDNAVITSRNPDDLEAFVAKIIEEVREGKHERKAA